MSGDWLGKLPAKSLKDVLEVKPRLAFPSTIIGPEPGEDAAIIDLGCCDLVMHVDPITEAGTRPGWLAVHVASNDIAVTGARPKWIMLTVLAREGSSLEDIMHIVRDAQSAAREVGAEIVGGHTEITPGLGKTIVQAAAVGYTCRGCSVRTSGARPGDMVLQVKPAALEGTAIIALDFRDKLEQMGVPGEVLDRASKLLDRISVVREALMLAENGMVTSMHDPTEGGLIGGLVEVAMASRLSLNVYLDRIVVAPETRYIADKLGIDPLKLISSGTIIATVSREEVGTASQLLERAGVEYSIIGEVSGFKGYYLRVIEGGGRYSEYNEVPMDEITRVIEEHGKEEG